MKSRTCLIEMTLVLLASVPLGCDAWGVSGHREVAIEPARAAVDARETLLQAAGADDHYTRAYAMESIGRVMGARQGGLLAEGLNDRAVVVRFAAAMAIADCRYRPARDRLVELVEEPKTDMRVVCAAIYGLHRMGIDRYNGQLGVMLTDSNDDARATAARVMGLMDEPSAVGPLKSLLAEEREPEVQLTIIMALAKLGDKSSINLLESYAKGYYLDQRLLSIPVYAETAGLASQLALEEMLNSRHPPRVRVVAAGSLGRIDRPSDYGYDLCVQAVREPREMLEESYDKAKVIRPEVVESLEQLAARALGEMGNPNAIQTLHPMLENPAGAVQVMAAESILRLAGEEPTRNRSDSQAEPTSQKPELPPDSESLETSGGMD